MHISIELRLIVEIIALLLAFAAGWVTQKKFITYKMFVQSMKSTLMLAAYIKGVLTINDLDISEENKLVSHAYPEEIKKIVGSAIETMNKEHKFSKMLRSSK